MTYFSHMLCFTTLLNTCPYKRFNWKTYALGFSYEGFTFIKVYVRESRTGAWQTGETSEQGSSHHSLASRASLLAVASSYSQWRAWGEQPPPFDSSCSPRELCTRSGELVQFRTCTKVVLSQKSSSLSVPRHMTSLVVIGNLKNSLEASIHKHSKHNKEKGNITLDKNPRIS
jgi:hypothetical protein